MPTPAEIDPGMLTPELAAAARPAIAALKSLRAQNEMQSEDKACLAAANDALTVLATVTERGYSLTFFGRLRFFS